MRRLRSESSLQRAMSQPAEGDVRAIRVTSKKWGDKPHDDGRDS